MSNRHRRMHTRISNLIRDLQVLEGRVDTASELKDVSARFKSIDRESANLLKISERYTQVITAGDSLLDRGRRLLLGDPDREHDRIAAEEWKAMFVSTFERVNNDTLAARKAAATALVEDPAYRASYAARIDRLTRTDIREAFDAFAGPKAEAEKRPAAPAPKTPGR